MKAKKKKKKKILEIIISFGEALDYKVSPGYC